MTLNCINGLRRRNSGLRMVAIKSKNCHNASLACTLAANVCTTTAIRCHWEDNCFSKHSTMIRRPSIAVACRLTVASMTIRYTLGCKIVINILISMKMRVILHSLKTVKVSVKYLICSSIHFDLMYMLMYCKI